MKIIKSIKDSYARWSEKRFLKRHGCDNRRQYELKYDQDRNKMASRIQDYYHGYPYVYCFENREHQVYYWDIAIDGSYIISEWCSKNCSGKFRMDFHRVYKNHWDQWEINEIGGGDYIFAAFKDSQDFTLFVLKWS